MSASQRMIASGAILGVCAHCDLFIWPGATIGIGNLGLYHVHCSKLPAAVDRERVHAELEQLRSRVAEIDAPKPAEAAVA